MNASDAAHFARLEKYAAQVEGVYLEAVGECSQMAAGLQINPDKPFSFDDYPSARAKANRVFDSMTDNVNTIIDKGMKSEIDASFAGNKSILENLTQRTSAPAEVVSKFKLSTAGAAQAFQERKLNGMNLSERIWQYRGQFKSQIEMGLDVSLGQGLSAQQTSRELKQYLQDPDKLFRRVRDKRGNLQLSRNAAAYHPGRGKYRSSHKNAMRVARTEINMAYHESNHERWLKSPWVVGFKVVLSNNHPVDDICDSMKGDYPKTFRFTGWHPHCRCHAIPILCSKEEYNSFEDEILGGNENATIDSSKKITNVPAGFYRWTAENWESVLGYQSKPYWIQNNFQGGSIARSLNSNIVSGDVYRETFRRAENLVARQRAALAVQREALQEDMRRQAAARAVADEARRQARETARQAAEQARQAQQAARSATAQRGAAVATTQAKSAAGKGVKGDKWKLDDKSLDEIETKGYNVSQSYRGNGQKLDAKDMEKYNEVLSGFNLSEFDDEIEALMKKEGIDVRHKGLQVDGGYITISIDFQTSKGSGMLERKFYLNYKDKRTVSHEYLKIPLDKEGKGVSKKLFQVLYKQYKNADINEISVHANLDVGGYTWGRYGFCVRGKQTAKSYIDGLSLDIKNPQLFRQAQDAIEMYYAGGRRLDDAFPMNIFSDMAGMKKYMLGSDWYGYIDLTNPVQRQRFEDYLFGRIQ